MNGLRLYQHRYANLKLRTLLIRHFLAPHSRGVSSTSMKRKLNATVSPSKQPKRQQVEVNDYCDVDTRKGPDGSILWPADEEAIENARDFLKEWYLSSKPPSPGKGHS